MTENKHPCGCPEGVAFIDEFQMCSKHREWLQEQEHQDFGDLTDQAWDDDSAVELPPSHPFGSHGVASAEARAERLCDEHLHHGSTPSYDYE